MLPLRNAPAAAGGNLLFPGAESEWEIWEQAAPSAWSRRPETLPSLDSPAPERVAVVGLPAAWITQFAFQPPAGDENTLRALAFAQLQRRRLVSSNDLPDEEKTAFDITTSPCPEKSNGRLAMVEMLDPGIESKSIPSEAVRFEPTTHLLPLPRDGYALWRENRRLTLAVTRNGFISHCQTLDGNSARLASGLVSLRQILELQDLSPTSPELRLWTDLPPQTIEMVGSALNAAVIQENRPAPRLPERIGKLVPPVVREFRTQKIRHKKHRNILTTAILFYLLLTGAWLGVNLLKSSSNRRLQSQINALMPEVNLIQDTARRWTLLRPAIDISHYPLVLLNTVQKAVPEGGNLWLTDFHWMDGALEINGKASNVDFVYQFQRKLTAAPEFGELTWSMDTPAIQSNGEAQFHFTTKTPNANAQ